VAVDITERKLAEEALRESETKTRTILDNAADGIITTDDRGVIESFNPAAAQIFGSASPEVIGQNIRLLIPRPYLPEHESYHTQPPPQDRLNVLSRGREVSGRRKNGEAFPLELAVSEVRLETKRMFVAVVRDITERKAAEEELTRSRGQLRALAARLESIREEERTRIAREVHDVLGQALTSLKMDLSWISLKTSPGQDWLEDRTVMMSDLIDSTIQTVRKIAIELRPPVLDNLGLAAAIEWQASEFQSRTGMPCRCLSLSKDLTPDPLCATALFRIFQETLTNVARHAHATLVEVSLREEAGHLVLEVKDNGRGISAIELASAQSLGLLGMRERASILGGVVTIVGAPGEGTTVKAKIPANLNHEKNTDDKSSDC
jgi:two-component system sensor kinase